MSTNAPEEEKIILVRGSAEHKDYLRYQFGRIKDTVNSFETRIAVSGRAMLLLYVVYITVKAGVGNSLPQNMPAWLNTALVVLDIIMLAMQVLGLEGSVPGLRHLAEELEDKGKAKEAKTVRGASTIAQWLLAATAIDIVLQRNHIMGTWDLTNVAIAYTNCLFILRVVVIGLYLIAMAKLEHRGPRVISSHEAAKQQEKAEQKQIKMDNASIQVSITQAMEVWTKAQEQKFSEWSAVLASNLQSDQARLFADLQQQVAGVQSQIPTIDTQAIAETISAVLHKQIMDEVRQSQAQIKQAFSYELNQMRQTIDTASFAPMGQPRMHLVSSIGAKNHLQESAQQGETSRTEEDKRAWAIRLWFEDPSRSTSVIAGMIGEPRSNVARWIKPYRDVQSTGEMPAIKTDGTA